MLAKLPDNHPECAMFPPVMRQTFLVGALAAATHGVAAPLDAAAARALLERNKCYLCHADNEPKAGPAYVDVAARYEGSPRATSMLIATVQRGSHGAGPWHMPPHPELSDADAKLVVRYILSLK
jgi:cytochrome c